MKNLLSPMNIFQTTIKTPDKTGFTMIELLVVTTIVIVLSAIGIVSYNQAMQSARNGRRKADLEVIKQALVMYKADNGYYPDGDYASLGANLGTDYLSVVPADPKTSQTYTYVPGSCAAAKCYTFTLGATLEVGSSTTPYTITNP